MSIRELVRRDGHGYVEFLDLRSQFPDPNWDYAVSEKEFMTRRGLIRWIEHMSEKNWITTEHIRQLCRISSEIASKKIV